jgi:alpha-tubulin suppressor-like RCC1 family protein
VDGEPSAPRPPTQVDVDLAIEVAAGANHSCALTADGVVCWGSARYGQTGRGASEQPHAPLLVPDTGGAVEVASGVRHACARFADHRVACWGELIDEDGGEPRVSPGPVFVAGLEDAVSVSTGAGHTCVLREDRRVACFGRNESGQLGDGTRVARAHPVLVEVERSLEVSAGGIELDGALVGHTCARSSGFHVSCWGRNVEGQLGIGRAPDSANPQVVHSEPDRSDQAYLSDIKAIAAGGLHSCGIEDDGELFCFGDDTQGQRALPDDESPVFGRAQETRPFGGVPGRR